MMIKLKNLLAENMFRFGTKNISESAVRQKLTEDSNRNILILTIYLPQRLNPTTKQLEDVKVGTCKYVSVASKSPDDTTGKGLTTDEYAGIKGLFINGISATQVTSKKDPSTGNISGTFTLTDKIYDYLKDFVGKPASVKQSVYGNVTLATGGTEVKYASWTVAKYTIQTTAPK